MVISICHPALRSQSDMFSSGLSCTAMLTWGEGRTGAAPNLHHPVISGFQALSQVGRPPLVSRAQTDRPCSRQRGGGCKFPTLCQTNRRIVLTNIISRLSSAIPHKMTLHTAQVAAIVRLGRRFQGWLTIEKTIADKHSGRDSISLRCN